MGWLFALTHWLAARVQHLNTYDKLVFTTHTHHTLQTCMLQGRANDRHKLLSQLPVPGVYLLQCSKVGSLLLIHKSFIQIHWGARAFPWANCDCKFNQCCLTWQPSKKRQYCRRSLTKILSTTCILFSWTFTRCRSPSMPVEVLNAYGTKIGYPTFTLRCLLITDASKQRRSSRVAKFHSYEKTHWQGTWPVTHEANTALGNRPSLPLTFTSVCVFNFLQPPNKASQRANAMPWMFGTCKLLPYQSQYLLSSASLHPRKESV